MSSSKPQLIVALDVDTFDEARSLIDRLSPVVEIFKVGSQLFTACGPVIVRHILARGKNVFLDLKYHDIPNTVANAVAAAVHLNKAVATSLDQDGKKIEKIGRLSMLTIHTQGGAEMCAAAAASASKAAQSLGVTKPLVLGITVLTSQKKEDNIRNLVLERARLAKQNGLDGVVASSQEASLLRKEFGRDFVIVTPGIRPLGADTGDQKRITTPKEAIENGSDYLVVGRPIVKSNDPVSAVQEILKELIYSPPGKRNRYPHELPSPGIDRQDKNRRDRGRLRRSRSDQAKSPA
jgi:orotidine-5'-phosphate decarboxylase